MIIYRLSLTATALLGFFLHDRIPQISYWAFFKGDIVAMQERDETGFLESQSAVFFHKSFIHFDVYDLGYEHIVCPVYMLFCDSAFQIHGTFCNEGAGDYFSLFFGESHFFEFIHVTT